MSWQTIDTAPKDGEDILVWTHRGYCEIANWDDDKYAAKPRPFWKTTGPWGKTEMRETPPTHWMPLPEPPKP